ncbi:MAG: hypothetical protein GY953_52050 [bacterium]|nr:hypothetical protein [bacterium]
MTVTRTLLAGALLGSLVFGQAPIASRPVVNIEGVITAVKLTHHQGRNRGQHSPTLEVKATSGDVVKVRIGPMRFLMEQDFSPEVGDEIQLKAFSMTDGNEPLEAAAITVKLPKKKQEITLRSEDGYPVWSGRRQRGGQGR